MEEKDEVKLEENVENKTSENESTEVNNNDKNIEKQNIEKPLTDDELYTKIQTEKLLKNQKVKKISIISVLSVVFALAIVIICLASIPLNLKPDFLNPEFL